MTETKDKGNEYVYLGIRVTRTMSRERGAGTRKTVSPLKDNWCELAADIFAILPDQQDKMSEAVIVSFSPTRDQYYSEDMILTEDEVQTFQHNLLKDIAGKPFVRGGRYTFLLARVYEVRVDYPAGDESLRHIASELISGDRNLGYDSIEILRLHRSSAEAVKAKLFGRTDN